MLLWFAGLAVVAIWFVFHDPALDVRMVLVGVLAPDLVDGLAGAGVMHTLALSAVLLTAVMLGTRHRRRLRRRLLGLPMGTLLHLALDAAWSTPKRFWWPALGDAQWSAPLPAFDRPLVVVVLLELAGLAALVWAWRTFRLSDPVRRSAFLHSGRLEAVVEPDTTPDTA